MAETTRLENIEIVVVGGRRSIRFDWDNDYHHMLPVRDTTPDGVIAALEYAVNLIRAAKYAGRV